MNQVADVEGPDHGSIDIPDAKAVRGWLTELRTPDGGRRSLSDELYRLYVAGALIGLPVGWVVVQALGVDPLGPEAQTALHGHLGVWLPAGLLLVCLAGLRLGTWRGPVVFADADIAWLLSAPVPRAGFIRPRLIRGLVWTALLGAVVGGALWVGLIAHLDTSPTRLLAACAASGALVGAVTAAGSWMVECRPSWARAVLRITPLVLVAAVGVVIAGEGPAAMALRWSGPWGWATAPVLASAGASAPVWPLAAALLGLVTVAAVVWAVRTAGMPSLEELRRRTGTAQAVATGVFWLDTGAVTGARREAVSTLIGRRLHRMPFRPRKGLVIPWIGATVLLRGPWLWGRAVLMVIAGSVAGWAAASSGGVPGQIAWSIGAAICGYIAAGALVEPVKIEVAQRFGIRHLTWPIRTILVVHLALPAFALAVLVALAAVVTAVIAGAAELAWVAAAGVVLTVPGLMAAAAFGALREPPDVFRMILLFGEMGMAMYATQAMLALLGGVLVTLPPVISFAAQVDGGASPAAALVTAGGVAIGMAALAGAMLWYWLADDR